MITNNMQQYRFIYLFLVGSTCFGRCFGPSSGARDCIYSIWYSPPILLPAGFMDEMELSSISSTSCNTQSSAPEDGQNNCPKHVELTGIINKPLLLHLVGCLYFLYFIILF